MQPNLMQQIKEDHRRALALCSDLERCARTSGAECSWGLEALRRELIPHFRAEETTLYPMLRGGDTPMAACPPEHGQTERLLGEMLELHLKHGLDSAIIRNLSRLLECHFSDEEERISREVERFDVQEEREMAARFLTTKKYSLSRLAK